MNILLKYDYLLSNTLWKTTHIVLLPILENEKCTYIYLSLAIFNLICIAAVHHFPRNSSPSPEHRARAEPSLGPSKILRALAKPELSPSFNLLVSIFIWFPICRDFFEKNLVYTNIIKLLKNLFRFFRLMLMSGSMKFKFYLLKIHILIFFMANFLHF